jgi:hypothetical protein
VISTKTAVRRGSTGAKAYPRQARSSVDDGRPRPYKAAKWRRAEILPPMFFQEQLETRKPRAAVEIVDCAMAAWSEG